MTLADYKSAGVFHLLFDMYCQIALNIIIDLANCYCYKLFDYSTRITYNPFILILAIPTKK